MIDGRWPRSELSERLMKRSAMDVSEQPVHDDEDDDCGKQSAAELPRNQAGETTARRTFHEGSPPTMASMLPQEPLPLLAPDVPSRIHHFDCSLVSIQNEDDAFAQLQS